MNGPEVLALPMPKRDPNRNERGQFVPGNQAGTPWQPGQSGNPNGSSGPKIKVTHFINKFGHLSIEELEKMEKDKKLSAAETIAVKQLLIASRGSLPHAQEIVNRTEGMLKQQHSVEVSPIKVVAGFDPALIGHRRTRPLGE